VLDGRDIGTVICPDADVKLWIDADVRVRAGRRLKEYAAAGESLSLDEMVEALKERDARDRARADAPMTKAADAVLIDTSALSIDEAVERACHIIDAAQARKETS